MSTVSKFVTLETTSRTEESTRCRIGPLVMALRFLITAEEEEAFKESVLDAPSSCLCARPATEPPIRDAPPAAAPRKRWSARRARASARTAQVRRRCAQRVVRAVRRDGQEAAVSVHVHVRLRHPLRPGAGRHHRLSRPQHVEAALHTVQGPSGPLLPFSRAPASSPPHTRVLRRVGRQGGRAASGRSSERARPPRHQACLKEVGLDAPRRRRGGR